MNVKSRRQQAAGSGRGWADGDWSIGQLVKWGNALRYALGAMRRWERQLAADSITQELNRPNDKEEHHDTT